MMLSKEERAAIEARVAAASPAPWSAADEHGLLPGASPAWCVCLMRAGYEHMDDTDVDDQGRRGGYLGDVADVGDSEADAEFIAHARQDIPALLAALADAERERDEAQAKVARVESLVALMERAEEGVSGFLHMAARTRPTATVDNIRAALDPRS